jgi:NAD(P)-dependent dehydrogenase (short-subunit alcohol dehydrogenase family)
VLLGVCIKLLSAAQNVEVVMTPFNVSDQRVVVTGAAQGIGYSVAKAFAIAGADLVMLDISKRVEESASVLSREVGRKITNHNCDIADRVNVYATVGALGRIDVLVNNAGALPLIEPGGRIIFTASI